MIEIKLTENYAGVSIAGDYLDLDELYEAIHNILGDVEEGLIYDDIKTRVLALNYDLRHSKQGDRELEFKENGITDEIIKWHSTLSSKTNTYFKFNFLIPEAIFTTIALNFFIKQRMNKLTKAKSYYYEINDYRITFDKDIYIIKSFLSKLIMVITDRSIYGEKRFK